MLANYTAKEIPSVFFNTKEAFTKECEDNHMRVQEGKSVDSLRAFYGDEYMGYFDQVKKEGFVVH
jgi:hypothetical protein